MTISDKDLFLAILSMDSYNRGYNPGIEGLGGVGTSIGGATFFTQSSVTEGSPGVSAGFYAAAYDTDWGTVISYRGKDSFVTLPGNEGLLRRRVRNSY